VASVLLEELSHEMNNALSSLQFNLNFLDHATRELMAQPDAVGLSGDARARMTELTDAVTDSIGAARHVQGVLARTRSKEHGRDLRARFTPLDLRVMAETTARMAVPDATSAVRMVVDVPAELPEVSSDPTAVSQILLNLLLNSVQSLDSHKPGNLVRVEAVAAPGYVLVRVSDSGCGIQSADLERVFEARFTTKPGSGNGLGLAVSRDLARQLGGDLSVESEPGKGSTFTLHLPL